MKKNQLLFCLMFVAINLATSQNPMMIPPAMSGTEFNLTLQKGTHQFFDGIETNTFGVNGDVLGPTLIFKQGDNVDIKVTNKIGQTSTIHWHGMHITGSNDGGPHSLIKPDETWNPKFKVLDKASTMWYHPHLHKHTNDHVLMGLGGMIIIQDDEEAALDLPRTYGVDDFPVVLQTKTFDNDKQIVLGKKNNDKDVMANATLDAYLDVPAQVIRLRVLNASSQRIYNLGLSTGEDFILIGTEGGLFGKPVSINKMLLAPGERAEILLDLTSMNGQSLSLKNFGTGIPNGYYGTKTMNHGNSSLPDYNSNPLNGADFDLLKLNVGTTLDNAVTSIPETLVDQIVYKESDVNKTRQMNFRSSVGGPSGAINGPFRINNAKFDMNVINETVQLGDIEIWEFTNRSAIAHPFHIHDVQFYVLDINGQAPPPEWRGRKDVILVPPFMGTVRFITKFEDHADDPIPYMYHCHMLTHEDEGMMGQFTVVSDPNAVEDLAAKNVHLSPNPTLGQVTVSFDTIVNEKFDINVFDALGRSIQAPIQFEGKEGIVDLTSFSRGVYMLEIRYDTSTVFKKVVKD